MIYLQKKVKLKTIRGKQRKILLWKNNKNGNCKAGSFPFMPHDMPSLRCILSGWYELPRWREQKPWTARELRRKPGRRTIRIHRTHSQEALVSGGVVQFQQHNNSLSPAYTDLQADGECLWRWWDTNFGRYKHKVQSKPRSTLNLD